MNSDQLNRIQRLRFFNISKLLLISSDLFQHKMCKCQKEDEIDELSFNNLFQIFLSTFLSHRFSVYKSTLNLLSGGFYCVAHVIQQLRPFSKVLNVYFNEKNMLLVCYVMTVILQHEPLVKCLVTNNISFKSQYSYLARPSPQLSQVTKKH